MTSASSRHVMIAIPAHDHAIKIGTMLSVLRAKDQLNEAGHTVAVRTWMGDSLLPAARNTLLAYFHRDKAFTDFVFWDHDVWCNGDEFMRLLSHPVDFVGGSYRYKSDDENYPMGWLDDPENKGLRAIDPLTGQPSWDGLLKVNQLPGGFLRITRNAVEQLFERYAARLYKARNAPGLECCCLFEVPFLPGVGLVGEDYIFCERWREIGGTVWLDPTLDLHHSGHKEYMGSLASYLLGRDSPKGEDAEKELRSLRAKLNTPEIAELFRVALGEAA